MTPETDSGRLEFCQTSLVKYWNTLKHFRIVKNLRRRWDHNTWCGVWGRSVLGAVEIQQPALTCCVDFMSFVLQQFSPAEHVNMSQCPLSRRLMLLFRGQTYRWPCFLYSAETDACIKVGVSIAKVPSSCRGAAQRVRSCSKSSHTTNQPIKRTKVWLLVVSCDI